MAWVPVLIPCLWMTRAWAEDIRPGTAPELTRQQREFLGASLRTQAKFGTGYHVTLTYRFDDADEILDWVEYPPGAGRGSWVIRDKALVGQGRLGLRHPWMLSGDLRVQATCLGNPGCRFHLFDSGQGRGAIETDLRAVYLPSASRVENVPWPRRKKRGTDPLQVVLCLRQATFRLDADGRSMDVSDVPPASPGYVGLIAWGGPAVVDEIEIDGELDPSWARQECLRLAAVEEIESKSRVGHSPIALMASTDDDSWPWFGIQPSHDRVARDCILAAGREAATSWIGARHWSDYVIEGRLLLSPDGWVRCYGRVDPHRRAHGWAGIEFRPGRARISQKNEDQISEREVAVPALPSSVAVAFRVAWDARLFTVDLDGSQVFRAPCEGPARGQIAIELAGDGTRVWGLSLGLTRADRPSQ